MPLDDYPLRLILENMNGFFALGQRLLHEADILNSVPTEQESLENDGIVAFHA